jgi:dTDP-4-dehydrorhamnose 3,5-epimerase-like enzyme
MPELAITQTPIPGLLVISLDIRGDNRGWFKENWQREKMTDLGVPDFTPVQNNMSFNDTWHPCRTVGQARVTGNRADLRCLG